MINRIKNQKIDFASDDFKIIARDQIPTEAEQAFHEEIEIKYFYEGSSTLMINSELIRAKAGDIAVVNPYELHSNVDIAGSDGRYYLIIVGLDFVLDNQPELDMRRLLVSEGKKISNLISNDKRLQSIVLRVIEEMQNKEQHYKLIVRNLMSEFFALLIRNRLQGEESEKELHLDVNGARVISPALSKIHKDCGERLTVEELADLCYISKYHFCRVFKQVMGMTVVQYIVKYRVDLAEIMLRETNKSVNEVASFCGFSDESYFYRCFKRIKGRSPKQRSTT